MSTQQDLAIKEYEAFKASIVKSWTDFKLFAKTQKGKASIVEYVSRFIPIILYFILGSLVSKYEPSNLVAFIAMGIPLIFVGLWVAVRYIVVKRFGVEA